MGLEHTPPLAATPAGAAAIAAATVPATASALGARAEALKGQAKDRAERRARRHAEDAALVRAVRGGDPAAFPRLVERYQRRVYWLAHDILLDADEARDVAQETFLRVYASLDRYDERRDFVNWLYRIARNLAIDLLRRRRRHALPVDDVEGAAGARGSEDVADDLRSVETGRLVREVLATLPVEYRTALTLRDLHGMSPREIAAVTDCTYPTARWRIHRARALFREAWDERVGPNLLQEPTS
ncbi:MAG: RNA polymerase sigma factor [Planctomycetota bacterium]